MNGRVGGVALWVAFTAVAVVAGLVAAASVRQAVTEAAVAPMSQRQVADQLAQPTPGGPGGPTPPGPAHTAATPSGAPPSARPTDQPTTPAGPGTSPAPRATPTTQTQTQTRTPTPTPARPPSVTAVARTLSSPGGSVVARCTGSTVYLQSWSPANGWRVHDVERGPAASATVEFENGGRQVTLVIGCVGGVPRATSDTGGAESASADG